MDKDNNSPPANLAGRSRADLVYETLRNRIKSRQYGVGERIREEEVARSLGVSRTPVREALAKLQSRGMLEVTAGGLVVVELSRTQIIELYAMREVLEGSAARFAAQHASPTDVATLQRLNDNFAAATGDPSKQARINRDLHETINETAHNRYLTRVLQDTHDWLALLPSTTFAVPGRGEIAVAEHARIIEAIASHDLDGAEVAARQHIRMAQMARLEMMFERR